jgi:hypothetical protein
MKPLLERVQDEADLCRNEGAQDIADLLDETEKELGRLYRIVDAGSKEIERLSGRQSGVARHGEKT